MISDYEHPYLTVDCVLLRFNNKCLEVLLIRQKETGKVALPGGFMDIDKCLDETVIHKVKEKTNVDGFYMEQLKTFDALDRDKRDRIVTVAYLALTDNSNKHELKQNVKWCPIHNQKINWNDEQINFEEMAFDHGLILKEALQRLKNKIWYSDLLGYLLPEQFILRDIQSLCEHIEGKTLLNFRRNISEKIRQTGKIATSKITGGRPAVYLEWIFSKERK